MKSLSDQKKNARAICDEAYEEKQKRVSEAWKGEAETEVEDQDEDEDEKKKHVQYGGEQAPVTDAAAAQEVLDNSYQAAQERRANAWRAS